MSKSFRALCAELIERLGELDSLYNIPSQAALIERVSAALAQADEPAVPPLYARQTGIGQWEGADHPSGPWRKVLPAALARWGNPAAAPAGVLVSRVAQSLTAVFQNGPYTEGANRWDEQAASAAIREVAKWLDGQDYTGTSADTPGNIAEWLRQELENND